MKSKMNIFGPISLLGPPGYDPFTTQAMAGSRRARMRAIAERSALGRLNAELNRKPERSEQALARKRKRSEQKAARRKNRK